jgi:hypothetical protein
VVDSGISFKSTKGFFDSLSLVLTGRYLNDADSTCRERQEQQCADLAALIMEYKQLRPPGHSDGFLASLSFEDKDLVQSIATRGSEHEFVQNMA